MTECFRALDMKSGGPWFKFYTLPLYGFVLNSPEFNFSTALCKQPTGQPPASYIHIYILYCIAPPWGLLRYTRIL